MARYACGRFAVLAIVLSSAAHQASAQEGRLVEVTPFVSDDSTFRWRFGAALSFPWTSQLNVETEIGASTTINQARGDELSASAGLVYSLRRSGRFLPYVAGGAGLEQYRGPFVCAADCNEPRDIFEGIQGLNRAVALNVGGGLKIPIVRNLRFRADARWLHGMGREANDHWRLYTGVTFGLGRRAGTRDEVKHE